MKKRIVTLICMFTLLFSVGVQALYYPNGGEAYNIGVTAPVFYLGRYWDRVTGYLSERSDPLVLQICADYGIPMKELDDGKPRSTITTTRRGIRATRRWSQGRRCSMS